MKYYFLSKYENLRKASARPSGREELRGHPWRRAVSLARATCPASVAWVLSNLYILIYIYIFYLIIKLSWTVVWSHRQN